MGRARAEAGGLDPALTAPPASGPYAGRTLVVLNPAAGQGDPGRLRRALAVAFHARGAPFDLRETAAAGDAERFAREGAELGYRAIVAVGGDGTVGEVITGVAGTAVPVGVVPRGTGNQVAHNLGIPRTLAAAVEVAVHGTPSPMDVGRLDDGRYFALAAGAGWDAEVIARATRERKDRWGFGAYLFAGLSVRVSTRVARFRIVADGKALELDASMVLVANVGSFVAPYLPLSMRVAPAASFRDGLLDVCIFAPGTRGGAASMLLRLHLGRHAGDRRMVFLQAREVLVESDPSVPTQMDGEVLGRTPLRARSVPGGVRVLV
ncbi:MAG: Lipid kinase, YegS/Rv2252/BmrU family [Gemmatimonadetes bacterium]|nr:Lipid kinase, YegS/Rv2252/BmrU family [Gemmatimonadota bacterium]